MVNHHQIAHFIWQIADLLRGPYRPPQYERVMLPMTVLRRFDCVLQPTKDKVQAEYDRLKDRLHGPALDSRLNSVAGTNFRFHNHSKLDFEKLKGDPDNIAIQLNDYINGFSENVRVIFERFEFEREIETMARANILYLMISRFSTVDLHPDTVDNIEMGYLFENLIRRFNEAANEIAQTRNQTMAQLALAWVLRNREVTSALIGASRVSQVEDSVGALENLDFSDGELQTIETILA